MAYQDSNISDEVLKKSKDKKLPCAVAFYIAEQNNVDPLVIGRLADQLDIKLCKCQIGLFGYKPNPKPIKPAKNIDPAAKEEIIKYAENGRISCTRVWSTAEKLKMTKLGVGSICEALNLKISTCQLGAF